MLTRRDFSRLSLVSAAAVAAPLGSFSRQAAARSALQTPWSFAVEREAMPLLTSLFRSDFVTKVASGTLPRESFCYYLRQNSFYLLSYAKSLSMLASRLPKIEWVGQVTQYASDTMEVYHWNRELLAKEEAHLWEHKIWSEKPMPTGIFYASFEAKCVAMEPVCVAWASLLPCFWVYDQLGQQLQAVKKKGNPYTEWIDALTTPEYQQTVRQAMALADALAEESALNVRDRMTDVFLISCRLEERFFNAAAHLEVW